MKLSVCMIAKNEAKMLEKTLPSLSKYVDEIIFVDTGSTDKTIETAEKFGAKIYHFPWINDFAAARNESLKHATGDWILWIDADEYLKDEDLKALRTALETSKETAHEITLYECKVDTCEKKNSYRRVKVFKNGLGYHFDRPINEQLVDGNKNFVNGSALPVALYHWGRNLEAERMQAKRERYVELYSKTLEKSPKDPNLHFLLANIFNDLKLLEKALPHYIQAAELAPDTEVGRQALEKQADLLFRMKKFNEAAAVAKKLIDRDQNNIPARNVFAGIYLVLGKVNTSIEILKETLNIKLEAQDANLYQSKAMPNFLLGKAYTIKGEKEKAQACFKKAQEIAPELGGGK